MLVLDQRRKRANNREKLEPAACARECCKLNRERKREMQTGRGPIPSPALILT
jgi:hypothetical protein